MLTGMKILSCHETGVHEGQLVATKARRKTPNHPNFMEERQNISFYNERIHDNSIKDLKKSFFFFFWFTCNACWAPSAELTYIGGIFGHPVCVSWVFESRPHSEMGTSSGSMILSRVHSDEQGVILNNVIIGVGDCVCSFSI